MEALAQLKMSFNVCISVGFFFTVVTALHATSKESRDVQDLFPDWILWMRIPEYQFVIQNELASCFESFYWVLPPWLEKALRVFSTNRPWTITKKNNNKKPTKKQTNKKNNQKTTNLSYEGSETKRTSSIWQLNCKMSGDMSTETV